MYLHLGRDIVVNLNDVIGIFDMDNTTVARSSREFLTRVQERGNVIDVTDELPKSYIVVQNGYETKVYISSISPATLLKRAKSSKIIV
jgi:hypothetical protein